MFYWLTLVSAFISIFGCAGVQTSPETASEFVVRRSPRVFPDGGGESYFYTAIDQDGQSRPALVLYIHEMYYSGWPGGWSEDAVFTVTAHPDHESLAGLYQRFPQGKILRPTWFTLGASDSYDGPLRGQIDHSPSTQIYFLPREAETSFTFHAPGGIRAGFVLQPLEFGRPGPVSLENDPLAGICPSAEAFTATMTYGEHEWMSPRLHVRFVGRSTFYSCRYEIDIVEGTLLPEDQSVAASH